MALLSALKMEIAIPVCVVIGIAFSLVQWRFRLCYSDNEDQDPTQRRAYDNEDQDPALGDQDPTQPTQRRAYDNEDQDPALGDQDPTQRRAYEGEYDEIKRTISEGVRTFLSTECWYAGVFVVGFAILIFLLLGSVEWFSTQSRPCKFDNSNTCKHALVTAVFSAVSFVLGASTSVLFGSLCMKIALHANAKTALEGRNIVERTFRSCAAMGFLLAAIDLLVLYLAIDLFKLYYGNDWEGLFEAITGYVLGGSSMALFARASGGIYAKAADVCVHLVIEIERRSPQTNRNPAVITNYVGDVVGDIAGMGPDLFGSYAGSSCAALVLASISSFGIKHNFTAVCYPLLINSMGILVCLITTVWREIKRPSKNEQYEQFIISTILMTFGILVVSLIALPSSFTIYNIGLPKVVKNWQLFLCAGVGLWAGLISGFVNKNYTNDDFSRPQDVNDAANNFCSCLRDDAVNNFCSCLKDVCAENLQSGLQAALENVSAALGCVSIPFFAAVSIFVGYHFAAMYGIAVAAIGMLSTIVTRLTIDASGPIRDNAKRIARMACVGAPEADDNTTAAIGKGFAIESAAMVSIALMGAFVNRPVMSSSVDVLTPKVIVGLIMGTWLPYGFSAMTMESVGRAGFKMALEVRKQLLEFGPQLIGAHKKPDYAKCFEIVTEASFRGVIGPGALVIFTPLIIGTVFGVETLSGVLAGSLGSVVQVAVSASKTDGAWNQAKEDIKAGALEYAKTHCRDDDRRTLLEIAKEGKTIGNKRKDTSGPPLNILVQLMAVESLVFAPFFASYGGLLFKFL